MNAADFRRLHDMPREILDDVAPEYVGSMITAETLVVYRRDEQLACPGCGHRQWTLGRTTAECAVCDRVLPLVTVFTPEKKETE